MVYCGIPISCVLLSVIRTDVCFVDGVLVTCVPVADMLVCAAFMGYTSTTVQRNSLHELS
jgi:hypothetical protein